MALPSPYLGLLYCPEQTGTYFLTTPYLARPVGRATVQQRRFPDRRTTQPGHELEVQLPTATLPAIPIT